MEIISRESDIEVGSNRIWKIQRLFLEFLWFDDYSGCSDGVMGCSSFINIPLSELLKPRLGHI